MMRIAMAPAAAALLRALSVRAGVDKNRILLSDVHSTDWQSLTFSGEQHRIALRITGVDSAAVAKRMCEGLDEEECDIPGKIVADIILAGSPKVAADGGTTDVLFEALTVASD